MTLQVTGSYFTPLVAIGTPYRSVGQITMPGSAVEWAPARDARRLMAYSEMTALLENRPWDVLERLRLEADMEEKVVMALAMPELQCNVWADAVYGDNDPPEVTLPTDQANDRWQAIAGANDLDQLLWEATFGTAALGTSVLKLRLDEAAPNGEEVVIEEVHPSIFFPVLKAGSARIMEAVVLAWEEVRGADEGKEVTYQVQQIHQVDAGQYRIVYQERVAGQTAWNTTKTEEPPGVDFLPFVDTHAKRWAGRYWGISELTRNWTLYAGIDEELSNIGEVLEYHGDPVLQVPASALSQGVLTKSSRRTLAIRRHEDQDVARYITWDGIIEARLKYVDKLIELAMLSSETPPGYWGILEGGSFSGTALKLRLQSYLKKAARYQSMETRRIRHLVDYALRLDPAGFRPEDRMAEVNHGSPLPSDEPQEIESEAAAVAGGVSSRKTAVRRLRRVKPSEVDAEVALIEKEQASMGSSGPAPLPNPPAPLGGTPGTLPPGA